MSLEELIDIVYNKRLTLKYPGLWEDKLEMKFLRCFENTKESHELINHFLKMAEKTNKELLTQKYNVVTDIENLIRCLIQVRCQCWTSLEDDYGMWKEKDRKIRLRINASAFESNKGIVVNDSLKNRLKLSAVSYNNKIDILKIMEEHVNGDGFYALERLILSKKDIYSNEKEYRLYLYPESLNEKNSSNICLNRIRNDFKYSYNEENFPEVLREYFCLFFYWLKMVNGLKPVNIPFCFDKEFSIRVSPFESKEFSNTVKTICEKEKIEFEGGSSY